MVGLIQVFNSPFLYITFNFRLILKCIEAGTDYMSVLTFYTADTIARLLMVINSSINFLVYCAGSSQFQVGFIFH